MLKSYVIITCKSGKKIKFEKGVYRLSIVRKRLLDMGEEVTKEEEKNGK